MKQSGTLKHFLIPAVIAVVVYAVFYYGIEYRRNRLGPWQVIFATESSTPTFVINEPKLNIANLKITFPQEKSGDTNVAIIFEQPQEPPFNIPFGQCVFEDITFHPGTLVFKMFGHEIQLLPRTLTIDRVEYPWHSDATIPVNKVNTSPGAR